MCDCHTILKNSLYYMMTNLMDIPLQRNAANENQGTIIQVIA